LSSDRNCYCRKIAELEDELKNKSEDLVHLERTRDKVQLICRVEFHVYHPQSANVEDTLTERLRDAEERCKEVCNSGKIEKFHTIYLHRLK